MKSKSFYAILAALLLASMMLAACQPAAPAAEEPAVEESFGEPEPTGEIEPMVVTNSECGEGDFIKEIAAVDRYTVRFTLCKPDPAFLAKAAFEPFAIQPKEYLDSTGGTGDILAAPIGTGPYKLSSWERGDSVNFVAFPQYWGEKALTEKAVIRWATESAGRLTELQAGTAHMITNLGPEDFATVEADANLKLIPQANPNIFYLGFTNTFEPFDKVEVRKAIAMGIDRQRIVDNFMPEGSLVAHSFTPCDVPFGCDGPEWYAFDPEAAKAMLAEAGFPDGFSTTIYYRDVARGYLANPADVAVEVQTQLKENLNIDAEVVVMETGEFIDEATNGRLDGIHLLGWGADYMHITNFLDFHFSRNQLQFGNAYPEIYEILEQAATMVDPGDLYTQANQAVLDNVPVIPVSHSSVGYASLANLEGAHVPPFGPSLLSLMKPAEGDTVVYMQNAEPISLFCTDETDGESLAACRQALEGLLVYNKDGEAVAALAESWEANEDVTEFTFNLRQHVQFHDGSWLDANDVVASFSAGVNAADPNHKGNTGAFEYPAYLFGLMND